MPFEFISDLTEDHEKGILSLYYQLDRVSIEQFPGFAEANTESTVRHYIETDENGAVTAYAQIDIRSFRIATIAFGPLAVSASSFKNALLNIKRYCVKTLTPILRVTPPHFVSQYDAACVQDIKKAVKYETSDTEINWSTLIISTAPSDEEILRKFADNHRQSVTKAIKMGLTVELVTEPEQIDVFSDQHSDMYLSRGLSIDKEKNKLHFNKLFDFFEKNNLGYFMIVRHEGSIIGGVCCAIQGNTARYLEGYSSPLHRKYPISHIALYEAIKLAKKRGLKYFDLGGYANNVKEGDQLFAINKFKEAFRGELVNYPPTMLVYNLPIVKWLYNLRKA